MSAEALLQELKARGGRVVFAGGQLRFRAAPDAVDDAFKQQLADCRREIEDLILAQMMADCGLAPCDRCWRILILDRLITDGKGRLCCSDYRDCMEARAVAQEMRKAGGEG